MGEKPQITHMKKGEFFLKKFKTKSKIYLLINITMYKNKGWW